MAQADGERWGACETKQAEVEQVVTNITKQISRRNLKSSFGEWTNKWSMREIVFSVILVVYCRNKLITSPKIEEITNSMESINLYEVNIDVSAKYTLGCGVNWLKLTETQTVDVLLFSVNIKTWN